MPTVPWPNYKKTPTSLTVSELIAAIKSRVGVLDNWLTLIDTQANNCLASSTTKHEPVDEHSDANRPNSYDDLLGCYQKLGFVEPYLQAAEKEISHVGGGSGGSGGRGGRGGRGGKKKKPGRAKVKRKPRPKPRTVKKKKNKKK